MRDRLQQRMNDTTMVSVISSYSYFEDTLYMVTLNQDASKLLRTVEIKPVFKQEKLECTNDSSRQCEVARLKRSDHSE